ncbi:DUF2690 domain-containing protein [Streptomyces roseirectus]|uniref:DUF2690 domain-containing protein n=1 Tax=Streptomyces roseirectus TaxID=2768066 RepID=A0A7H0ISL4_9ACTN|nr:DUF2690 domain-containing protein [Streptomyces roseirectus]
MPDELDARAAEFVVHMRRSVDRSGLSLTALAERTGYSRTSWERFLDGRLLAPRRAVDALAEATGTSPVHLTTLWELAEQSWHHPEPAPTDRTTTQLRAPLTTLPVREVGGPTEGNSWGLAGYRGPSKARDATNAGTSNAGATEASSPAIPGNPATPPPPAPSTPTEPGAEGRAEGGPRRWLTFAAATAATLALATTAFLLTDTGPTTTPAAATNSPSPSTDSRTPLPPGVKCAGTTCTGEDAETMGCGGPLATTAERTTVAGTVVEVRYSRTCAAAWGRILRAGPGDTVQVSAGRDRQRGDVTVAGDTDAYTPMVAVRAARDARACAVLASGERGCTQ